MVQKIKAAMVDSDVATQAELDSEASARSAAITAAVTAGVAGNVLQVVNTQTGAVATGSTTIPADDTIPQNTEGFEVMTLAVTPKGATNKLKIDVVVHGAHATSGSSIVAALFQDSTAGALACAFATQSGTGVTVVSFTHYMTAGTTSATTFKVRIGSVTAGTVTFNGVGGSRYYGGALASTITITEIKV